MRKISVGVWIAVALTMNTTVGGEEISTDALSAADYLAGRTAFQQRCSACHTLNDGGLGIAGPNLWRLFAHPVGSRGDFNFSEALKKPDFQWTPNRLAAWLRDPTGFLPGNKMAIPEAVPEDQIIPMLSFLMVETGDASWPRPEIVVKEPDPTLPVSERFPSFWNHLMSNTSRYRLVSDHGELIFKLYFQTDGSVSGEPQSIRGFWHVDTRNMFCYAVYDLPYDPSEFVECFPVAAMAIPRFAEELWQSTPAEGVIAYGGILPGRP